MGGAAGGRTRADTYSNSLNRSCVSRLSWVYSGVRWLNSGERDKRIIATKALKVWPAVSCYIAASRIPTHNADAKPAVVQCVSLCFEKDLQKRRGLRVGRPALLGARRQVTSVGKAAGPGANVIVSSLFLAAISTASLLRQRVEKVVLALRCITRFNRQHTAPVLFPKNKTPRPGTLIIYMCTR